MRDLIKELSNRAAELTDIGVFDTPVLLIKAAKALERLTVGNVAVPSSIAMLSNLQSGTMQVVHIDSCIDYGDRRAAAAVLAEREPITYEDIEEIKADCFEQSPYDWHLFAIAIEAKINGKSL